jgi:hypothetical protein
MSASARALATLHTTTGNNQGLACSFTPLSATFPVKKPQSSSEQPGADAKRKSGASLLELRPEVRERE